MTFLMSPKLSIQMAVEEMLKLVRGRQENNQY
jgi:hypothetical protein